MTRGRTRALVNSAAPVRFAGSAVPWISSRLFGRDAARTLEIGFGNGENLLELARRHPDQDFLGIEVHRPGVGRLLERLADEQLSNVRVICDDACDAARRLRRRCQSRHRAASISRIPGRRNATTSAAWCNRSSWRCWRAN